MINLYDRNSRMELLNGYIETAREHDLVYGGDIPHYRADCGDIVLEAYEDHAMIDGLLRSALEMHLEQFKVMALREHAKYLTRTVRRSVKLYDVCKCKST